MENENTLLNEEPKKVTYAGFWWRFLAYLIDQVIIGVASSIFVIPVMALFGLSIYSMAESGVDLEESPVFWGSLISFYGIMIVLSVLMNWLYFALMESSRHQGTVGKLVLNIKVTDYNFGKISFGRATGRFFGKYISSFILMIGYIMAGLTEKKQALPDMMASCYVIRAQNCCKKQPRDF